MMPHRARHENRDVGKAFHASAHQPGTRRSARQRLQSALELRLEELETRVVPSSSPILITPAQLAALRQEAQSNTSQWQSFENYLNSNLTQIVPPSGAYEGSQLSEVADYALGYMVLENINPTLANEYAGRATALMQAGLVDYLEGDYYGVQLLAQGNGSTTTYTLPYTGMVPGTLVVYSAPTQLFTVTHTAHNGQDEVAFYQDFISVSNTPGGPANYTKGVDWQRNGNYGEEDIDWSLGSANQPAVGATYYVTSASWMNLGLAGPYTYNSSNNTITFTTAPSSSQAIFVMYEYGNYQQTNSGDGGFNNIYLDDGYAARSLGLYESLGLNWLSGYSGFSSTLQTSVENMLAAWFNYLPQNGYYYTSVSSNYGAGEYVGDVMSALALNAAGYSQGPQMVSQMVSFRQSYVVPVLTNPTNSVYGGFWAEGWNYGQGAVQNVLLAALALDESGAIANDTAESQWASQATMDLISASPSAGTVYDGGDWYAFPAPFPGAELFMFLSQVDTNPTTLGYDSYIVQSDHGAYAQNAFTFMFQNLSTPPSSWSSAPLQDFASGTGLLTARSDWSSDPVWVSLQMGNLLADDHQTYEPGQLQIQDGGNDLLANANAITGNQWPKPAYGNTIEVSDNGAGAQNYLWGPGYWYGSPGVVTEAYDANSSWVYDYGNMSTIYSLSAYPGGGGSVSLLTRQMVYLRPNLIIVYDCVTTVQPTFLKDLDWNFINTPVVNGNSFTETVGTSELFGETFSLDPLSTTATSYSLNGTTVREVITANTDQVDNTQYVTAFDVGSAGGSMIATQQILTSDERMQGVEMGNYVVLFGRNGNVNLSTPVSYQVTGTSTMSNMLTNLVPGQAYEVYVDGVGTTTVTADSQGVITFTTPAGTNTIEVGNTGSTLGVMTHFVLIGSSSATAGGSFSEAVEAVDANNNIVTNYTGTVYFSSSDTRAGLPASYTFTNADAGAHTFTFTLYKAGSDTLSATDSVNSSRTGAATVAVSPAAAASLQLSAPSGATAGSAFSFTVTALDAYGNVASGYRGTVAFSSSEPGATLPGNHTFTAGDAGVHTFTTAAIFDRAGTQTLSLADTALGTLTAAANVAVSAAAASHFSISAPATAAAGGPFPVTVTALDPYGNVASGYRGTVSFTSSDAAATVPGAYTFTAADGGSHSFTVTLKTSGNQTLTVKDGSGDTGSATVGVVSASAPHLAVTGPSTATAGTPFSLTITVINANGTVDTGYAGTVNFTSSDGAAYLPANYKFTAADAGRHVFQITLRSSGSQSVTATDTAAGAEAGELSVSVTRKLTSTGPKAVQTAPNTALVFSSANNDPLSVSDEVGIQPLQETLTVSGGTVTLASTSGLSFTEGGPSASTTIVFSGTESSIDAALNGLIFQPTAGFEGNASLVLTTADPVANAASAATIVGISVAPNAPAGGDQGTFLTVGSGSSATLFTLTPNGTLYEHQDAIGWIKLGNYIQSISAVATQSGGNVVQLGATNIVLYAVTAGEALVRFSATTGWQVIGGSGSILSVSAGTDTTGGADAFVLTTNGDLMEFRDATGWVPSPLGGKNSVLAMQAGSNDSVVAITADHSLFEHNDTFGWYRLSGAGFAQSISLVTDASGNQTVFALTLGDSLYRFDTTGWTKLGNNITQISAGVDTQGNANVFAITENGDLAEWHGNLVQTWAPPSAPLTLLSAGNADILFAVAADGSIQDHDPTYGWLPYTGAGFAGL